MSGPKSPLDPRREITRRNAVGDVRQRISVSRRIFSKSGERAEVVVDGEHYVVDMTRLAALQRGSTPADLGLVSVDPDRED